MRRHGAKGKVLVSEVKECGLVAGELEGHDSIKAAFRMNNAVLRT